MRWDAVIEAVEKAALTDMTLRPIFGDAVRLAGTSKIKVPLLEVFLVADGEGELWAPCTVQWNIWVGNNESLINAERALRRLFHADLPVTIEGIEMVSSEYVDGDVLATPDRDGFFGRAVRFRHTPLRERYVAPGH